MSATERVVSDLNIAKLILCNPQMLTPEMRVRIGQAITSAIATLKQQEPVKPTRLFNEKVVSYKNVMYQYSCGNCSTLLRNSWKVCPLCGKEVKWK